MSNYAETYAKLYDKAMKGGKGPWTQGDNDRLNEAIVGRYDELVDEARAAKREMEEKLAYADEEMLDDVATEMTNSEAEHDANMDAFYADVHTMNRTAWSLVPRQRGIDGLGVSSDTIEHIDEEGGFTRYSERYEERVDEREVEKTVASREHLRDVEVKRAARRMPKGYDAGQYEQMSLFGEDQYE